MKYSPADPFHFAVRLPSGRHRRASDSRVRYRRPNEDTDTADPADVSCIKGGTSPWRPALPPV